MGSRMGLEPRGNYVECRGFWNLGTSGCVPTAFFKS